jgi:para-nitrobenzyl esterase
VLLDPLGSWIMREGGFWLLAVCLVGACKIEENRSANASASATANYTPSRPGPSHDDDEDAGSATDAGHGASGPTRIHLDDGDLEGKLIAAGDVRAFLGIAYAKPPVGELRWKLPQPIDKWSGLRKVTDFGKRCAQLESKLAHAAASDAEDCLYLNVWAPTSLPKRGKLPVLVWIHGGGHANGSASEPVPDASSGLLYSGETLAQNKNAVVVTFNYRLGAFGFFANRDLAKEGSKSGNQGLWDQNAALHWVRDNIANFGGDPDRVAIFGQSSGAFDVCVHVASSQARDLFSSAIAQSGGCTTVQPARADAENRIQNIAKTLGCSDAVDVLSCLRGKSTQEVLSAANGGDDPFVPVVDADYLTDQPRTLFDAGKIAKVPFILGSNTDEGTLFTSSAEPIANEADFNAALQKNFPAYASQLCSLYSPSKFDVDNPYQAAFARLIGDATFVCTTADVAIRASQAGAPTYLYNFDIKTNASGLGATDGAELEYVFGTSPSFSDDQRAVSDRMQGYWVNLAAQGDPNSSDLRTWPKFGSSSDVRLNFALSTSEIDAFRSAECAFWRGVYDADFASASH